MSLFDNGPVLVTLIYYYNAYYNARVTVRFREGKVRNSIEDSDDPTGDKDAQEFFVFS